MTSSDIPSESDCAMADSIIREVRVYGDGARTMIATRLSSIRIAGETAGMQYAFDELTAPTRRKAS